MEIRIEPATPEDSQMLDAQVVGFITMHEGHALYAQGPYGIISEFYVKPGHRSSGIGRTLIERAKQHAEGRKWKRLEATTPPLPEFDRTLQFYEKHGFRIQGGRKMGLIF